jgi:hypothetical protein
MSDSPSKTVSHDWLKRLYIELVNLATAPNGTTFPSWILNGKEFGELRRISQESPDETPAPHEDKADLLAMAALIARLGREQSYHVPAELLKRASAVLVILADSRTTRRHRGCGADCVLPAGHLGDHVPPEEPSEYCSSCGVLLGQEQALVPHTPECKHPMVVDARRSEKVTRKPDNFHLSDEVIETVRATCANAKDDPTEIWLSMRLICEEVQARRSAENGSAVNTENNNGS